MAEQPYDNLKNENQDVERTGMQNENENPQMQESILDGMTDFTGYDKNLRHARIWLYVIAGLQVCLGIYEYVAYDTAATEVRWMAFGIDAGIGLLFLACALWSFKKAYAAFLTALILYVLISIGTFILNPAGIGLGLIIKIVVIVALFRAVKDAREMEDIKNSLGN